jgi:hypothetical protein
MGITPPRGKIEIKKRLNTKVEEGDESHNDKCGRTSR